MSVLLAITAAVRGVSRGGAMIGWLPLGRRVMLGSLMVDSSEVGEDVKVGMVEDVCICRWFWV